MPQITQLSQTASEYVREKFLLFRAWRDFRMHIPALFLPPLPRSTEDPVYKGC